MVEWGHNHKFYSTLQTYPTLLLIFLSWELLYFPIIFSVERCRIDQYNRKNILHVILSFFIFFLEQIHFSFSTCSPFLSCSDQNMTFFYLQNIFVEKLLLLSLFFISFFFVRLIASLKLEENFVESSFYIFFLVVKLFCNFLYLVP